MKIAIMGASGTGKTTLAKLISEKYNIPYLEKKSPKIFDEIIENKKEPLVDKKNNALYMLSNCICRLNSQLSNESYVADRSVLDSYMYISLDFDFSFKQDILDFLIYSIQNNPYDLIIFIPKEFELSIEETKPRLDLNHRNKENDIANKIFNKFKDKNISKKCIQVSGTVEERIKKVSEVIDSLL